MKILARLRNCAQLLRRSRFHYYRMAMLRPPFWLSVNGQTCRIAAGQNPGAYSCYAEVVIEDCYKIFSYAKHANPKVIVDIGANLGVFSKLCALLFPQADIYAYEPNPSALEWLELNAAGTRIQVLPCAVGESSGLVELDTSYDSTIGRIRAGGSLSVQCVAASDIAAGSRIDFLKMDCEGSEWSILQNAALLDRTNVLRMEYHLFDNHSLDELRRLIEQGNHRILGIDHTQEGGKFGIVRSVHRSITGTW
jgi:FkbM family methyltransferase